MKQIQPTDLHQLLREGHTVRLIDVREREEFDHCRLPEAELFPLSEISKWESELAEEEVELFVYCHHGVRSARVCARLHALGHQAAINVAGGIDRWSLEVDPAVPRY